MYEVFPLVAGVVIALLVPHVVSARQRTATFVALGIIVAAVATIIAGEEWFFIFIDLAEVFIAMGVTLWLVSYFARRRTTPLQ
jgi:hypothetical protein